MNHEIVTNHVTVFGLVQGVGFRPYVAELAEQLHMTGTVRNAGGIVYIEIQGCKEAMEEFLHRLSLLDGTREELPGARVDHMEIGEADGPLDVSGFTIVSSEDFGDGLRFLPPDIGTCSTCRAQLLNPGDRRYRYPFISCVSCGPRATIMRELPYDREHTTMEAFPLCPDCAREYVTPGDIRRHAQTIACDACGPKLMAYTDAGLVAEKEEALLLAEEYLREGKLVAVKDIGGYHIAMDPYNEEAARRLRAFKNRENKPFAVMFPDVTSLEAYARVSHREQELLESDARPIVLLRWNSNISRPLAPGVCAGSNRLGAMLPCNPLQILLAVDLGPLVMTSGNRGGEPIEISDEKMCAYLGAEGIDLVLANDREILQGLDDSICQVQEDVIQYIRRARGIVPTPIAMAPSLEEDVLAVGGDLKSVFAFGRKNYVYLSGHYGDLEDVRAVEAKERGVDLFSKLFGFHPSVYLCDAHPGYISTKSLKKQQPGGRIYHLQHHMAHVASVLAEHKVDDPAIGFAYDGTGYGGSGRIWGGEMFAYDGKKMEHVGSIAPIPMTGGNRMAKDATIPAICYLHAAIKRGYLYEEENPFIVEPSKPLLEAALDNGIQTVESSSMGRLFDAVAAILGICRENTFEGECANRLQAAAERFEEAGGTSEGLLSIPIGAEDDIMVADTPAMIGQMVRLLARGVSPEQLAYEFHVAIAEMTADMCYDVRPDREHYVALSGGTMYNQLLIKCMLPRLKALGFTVLLNEQVPAGDGGLALGQIWMYAKQMFDEGDLVCV
ncbi:MAG: carbamoyltransferase HypF [Lachnospiraceae bacterium]|nr:carbamoyltransferase HypF [Lachnospiraceae bacterium]